MPRLLAIALLTLLCFTLCPNLSAQDMEAPDYESIRKEIFNNRAQSYYPSLMERFIQCDTTLSLQDYRNLYFGFPLREDFVPYQDERQSILDARRKMTAIKVDSTECQAILKDCQEALLDNPFDMIALAIVPICYYQMNDQENYQLWTCKLHGVLDAIGSSGDGATAESAFHVINIEHEYEILNRLNLELDQIEVVNDITDFVKVKENPDNIKGLYFNFEACGKAYKKRYK